MPHRIDPAMNPVKRPSLEPPLDRPPSNSGIQELLAPHHSMLRLRQLCKHPIYRCALPIRRTRLTFAPSEGVNVKLIRGQGLNPRWSGHDG